MIRAMMHASGDQKEVAGRTLGRCAMRRLSVLLSVVVLLSSAVVLSRPSAAQEATPAVIVTGDVTIDQTTLGNTDQLPTGPATIAMARIELPPGASLAYPADNPAFGAYVVESGTVTVNLMDDFHKTRDGQPHGVAIGGEDTQLEPGDGFFWAPNTEGEIRNDGSEPATLVVVTIVPGF
jgi:quercetin dioxygenase-like cupin family protein